MTTTKKKQTILKIGSALLILGATVLGFSQSNLKESTSQSSGINSFIKEANAAPEGTLIGCGNPGGSCTVLVAGTGQWVTLYGLTEG